MFNQRPKPPALYSRLLIRASVWAGVFARRTRSLVQSATVIVYMGYSQLLVFLNVKRFSFWSLTSHLTHYPSSNLLSVLLRCSTRPNKRGTQWDSKLLLQVSYSSLLKITLSEVPSHTIQVRGIRLVEHSLGGKNELISDVFLPAPTCRRTRVG